jgi:hypothetical protein
MSTSATLRAFDGQTIPELAAAMKANLAGAAHDCMVAAGKEATRIVADEGHHFYIRARKTRKPIHLGAKLGPHSAKAAIVYGIPAGFWAIVEEGSHRTWRIERKLLGRGKNRRAQLLGRKDVFGPVPYVIRKGQRPVGHPWAKAMIRVNRMPDGLFEPSVTKAFAGIWKG